jgi:putative tricarboxylic transport membrane protein
MEFIEQIGSGLLTVLSPMIIVWILIGVVLGFVFGAAPGLTATTAVAIFTPITYYLSLDVSLGLLLGLYCGGYYAGSIPAILINTPGAPGNAATTLDGYPLAQSGKAGIALSFSVIMMIFAPAIGSFALSFGPPEYFSLGILGLICVAGVSGDSLIKGVAAALIGMILATIGLDPIAGLSRFTLGNVNLMAGIALIPALVGLFALTELLNKSENLVSDSNKITKVERAIPKINEVLVHKWTILKSSIIGTIIGALPGTGPTIASWMSYNEAKRTSKKPEEYGKGSIEGIVASESSNNAVTGGALIPLLTLGIPGDTVTAVLLGALMIQGITPGPTLIADNYGIVAQILWILIIANMFLLVIGLLGSRYFPKFLNMPMTIMLPLIAALCVTGGYAVNNSIFDIKVLIILGIVGFFLLKFGFPIPPIVLGLVLGPIIESGLVNSLSLSNMNPLVFVTRPISASILLLTVILAFFMVRRMRKVS